jgi:hypothetical protein
MDQVFPARLTRLFVADDTVATTLKRSRQGPEVAAFLLLRYAMPCGLDTREVRHYFGSPRSMRIAHPSDSVCSCNACACDRDEETTTLSSASAEESERRATLAREQLEPKTVERLESLFVQMDLNGNGTITWDEAEAFFLILFDEVPLQELPQSDRVTGSIRREIPREQAAAMFHDADAKQDSMISINEFVGFWQMVKQFGYSDDEILEGLTSALERGIWRRWTTDLIAHPTSSTAWATPQRPASTIEQEASPPTTPSLRPDLASVAVLPIPGLVEARDPSEADEDELADVGLAQEQIRLLCVLKDSELGGRYLLSPE